MTQNCVHTQKIPLVFLGVIIYHNMETELFSRVWGEKTLEFQI